MPQLNISIEVSKDIEEIIQFIHRDGNIFQRTFGIGYWGYGVSIRRGWLIYEPEIEGEIPTRAQEREARRALSNKRPLPPRWYLLDRAAAERVVAEGLWRFGHHRFIDNNDLPICDEAIQWALLGEQRYG
jgi:hypothetical protein